MFYVYSHSDPITKQVFYIGKGTKDRAFSSTGHSEMWKKKVKSLHDQGLTYQVDILHICADEEEALDLEKIEIGLRLRAHQPLLNVIHQEYRAEDVKQEMLPPTIADFCRRRRKAAGLNQAQLASKAGVGLRFYRELEGGKKTSMRIDKVNDVLALFGAELGPVKLPR